MFYPKKFIDEVKSTFPNWEELHRYLDTGDVRVSDCLSKSFSTEISATDVLFAKSLEDLQQRAHEELEKKYLYHKWHKLYDEQNM